MEKHYHFEVKGINSLGQEIHKEVIIGCYKAVYTVDYQDGTYQKSETLIGALVVSYITLTARLKEPCVTLGGGSPPIKAIEGIRNVMRRIQHEEQEIERKTREEHSQAD